MSVHRRVFIKSMAATAAVPFTGALPFPVLPDPMSNYPVAFFIKPLDEFELGFMLDTLSMAGVDGIDLTVRPNGRVEPKSIEQDLPKVIEAAKHHRLQTGMMVTAITDAQEADTRRVLQTAARHGIKHYRMGPYKYDWKKGILASLDDIRSMLESLAQLNEETGIQGAYQNHSGTGVGAPMWDVWNLIQKLPPAAVSSQFDVRHAVTEGTYSWILALRLLSKNIGSLAIKDFTWDVSGGKPKVVNVPLGEGIVDFDLFFKTVKELNVVAPITLHIEYPFLSKEEESQTLLQKQQIMVTKIKKDVDFIRARLAKFQLV